MITKVGVKMTNKEKKNRLMQYAQIEKRVDDLTKEREHLIKTLELKPENVIKIKCIDKMLNDEIDELIDELEYITMAIKNVPNVNERRILWLHYVGKIEHGKRRRLLLWEVANEISYSVDWVKVAHIKALNKIKI